MSTKTIIRNGLPLHILSQYEPDRRWHPLSSYNKPFLPAELNNDVHDKEMVVIVNCFQE